MKDIIPTNTRMTNFNSGAITALGVVEAEITVGPKTMHSTFFVLDAKPTYSVQLGRNWIN